MELVPGVIEYTQQLLSEGHEISVVTSRSHTMIDIAQEWSWRNGLTFNFVGVGYGNSKADVARGLACYIDDDLDKLVPLRDIVPHRFLFSWGYNAHVDVGNVARRISSWEEFYNEIQKLQSAR
ncbi:MAG: hypothetical protein AAB343_03025 [Patescibacteria group bacterium]